jgi:hypothetical protein
MGGDNMNTRQFMKVFDAKVEELHPYAAFIRVKDARELCKAVFKEVEK